MLGLSAKYKIDKCYFQNIRTERIYFGEAIDNIQALLTFGHHWLQEFAFVAIRFLREIVPWIRNVDVFVFHEAPFSGAERNCSETKHGHRQGGGLQ